MPDRAGRRRGATVAFMSGKGGVGKTNLVANLAVLLAKGGRRVLILDGDLGLANVDVLLGLAPALTVGHFLDGTHTLAEVAIEGPYGLKLIPAACGVAALTDLDAPQRARLAAGVAACGARSEITLIDAPAGISRSVSALSDLADTVVTVTTPEPTALVDAYALIKVLHQQGHRGRIGLVVNCVKDAREGERIHDRLEKITRRFLGAGLAYWGHVVRDERILSAVREQRAVVELHPLSRIARCFEALALRLAGEMEGAPRRPVSLEPVRSVLVAGPPAAGGMESVN